MSVITAISAGHTEFVQSLEKSFAENFGSNDRPQSRAAMSDLDNLPFPTTKSEFWKYTRLNRLTKNQFRFATRDNVSPKFPEIGGLNAVQLIFVNGIFDADKSDELPSGVSMKTIDASNDFPERFNALAQPKKHVLESISTAFCPQTTVITVDADQKVGPVIHVANWSEGENTINQPRLIVQIGQGSKAEFMQSFSGDNQNGFTNSLSEIFVGENAVLHFYKLEQESSARFHHSADYARLESGSRFEIITAPTGGAWTRNNLHIKMAGSNAFARLNGLMWLEGDQHVDNNTFVDHAVPHCDSSELYKSVLDDKSTGVFNGKVIVRPDAQKTNAFQQNSNLLLSENAQINSKPELDIYADDVTCSHGSTTGQIDEEAIFYLQSRAIGKAEAQKMLIGAFVAEVVDELENEAIKNYLTKKFTH